MALLRASCYNPTSLIMVLTIHKGLPQPVSGIQHTHDDCCCGGCGWQGGWGLLAGQKKIPFLRERRGRKGVCAPYWVEECSLMAGAMSPAARGQPAAALHGVGCKGLQGSCACPRTNPGLPAL